MASHRRERMPKARKEIQDPVLQVAEPIRATLESTPPDRYRMSRDEIAAHERNSIRTRRARVRSTPREDAKLLINPRDDVPSGISESEFDAEVARFLDSLR
jgi:hypothetical protein